MHFKTGFRYTPDIRKPLFTFLGLAVGLMVIMNFASYVHPLTIEKTEKFAVILIDPWQDMPVEYWGGLGGRPEWESWWQDEVIPHSQNVLIPLVNYLREKQVYRVFSPNGREIITGLNHETYQEPIINDYKALLDYLALNEITELYYIGYATNLCVLNRPTGIKQMHDLNVDCHLVLDATSATPACEPTLEATLILLEEMGVEVINIKELKKRVERAY